MSSTSPLRQPSALARALRVRMARMSWWLHARAPEGAKRLLDLALVPPALVLLLPQPVVAAAPSVAAPPVAPGPVVPSPQPARPPQ
mgnify:CR=1 FL=1